MNLLSLILIAMALIVGACVFYVAWQLSSSDFEKLLTRGAADEEEPGGPKESEDPPGPR